MIKIENILKRFYISSSFRDRIFAVKIELMVILSTFVDARNPVNEVLYHNYGRQV